MCQLIGITNITGLNRKQINTIAVTSAKLMSSQRNGFGFAYATTNTKTKEDSYYCEKYVNPAEFQGIGSVGFNKSHFKHMLKVVDIEMLSSGHANYPNGGFIAHGRIATSAKNLANTHPFRKKGYALVHNGIVEAYDEDISPKKLMKRYSTCDSEWLLNTYAFGKGHNAWSDHFAGYAATLTLTPQREFIAAKGEGAKLYCTIIPKLNKSIIFSTVKEHGKAIAKALDMQSTSSYQLKDNTAVIVDNKTGKIAFETFEEMDSFRPYTKEWNTANTALGNELIESNNHTHSSFNYSSGHPASALNRKNRKGNGRPNKAQQQSNYNV